MKKLSALSFQPEREDAEKSKRQTRLN